MTTRPPAIGDNQIFQQMTTLEEMIGKVYEGTLRALIIYGPPGIGKTTAGERVAAKYKQPWRPERPGTMLGLMRLLYDRRSGGVLICDDIDRLWDDQDSLDVLKVALDTTEDRYLSHTVGGSKKFSQERFKLDCRAIFISNRDFRNERDFRSIHWNNGIKAIKDRSMLCGLSFEPLACYYYTGWLATEGRMLRRITAKLIANGKKAKSRSLTLAEANDVLDHFHDNAPRYPSIGPRDLGKFARLRIGAPKAQWLKWCEQNLCTPDAPLTNDNKGPPWNLPSDIYRYQIVLPAKATPPASAEGEAKSPEPAPLSEPSLAHLINGDVVREPPPEPETVAVGPEAGETDAAEPSGGSDRALSGLGNGHRVGDETLPWDAEIRNRRLKDGAFWHVWKELREGTNWRKIAGTDASKPVGHAPIDKPGDVKVLGCKNGDDCPADDPTATRWRVAQYHRGHWLSYTDDMGFSTLEAAEARAVDFRRELVERRIRLR